MEISCKSTPACRQGRPARWTPVMQKVLVVDDDPHIRDVVCFALRRAGYQPLPAANGLAALDLVAREMPALVVLDILMPELDGTEVCRRLRRSATCRSSSSPPRTRRWTASWAWSWAPTTMS